MPPQPTYIHSRGDLAPYRSALVGERIAYDRNNFPLREFLRGRGRTGLAIHDVAGPAEGLARWEANEALGRVSDCPNAGVTRTYRSRRG
jgi:hypothetical protein